MSAKAILIDPNTHTVSLIDLPAANLAAMYAAIGCDTVDLVRITEELDLWVDDEGLLVAEPLLWKFPGTSPYAGKGLLLTSDARGNSHGLETVFDRLDAMTDHVRAGVTWLSSKTEPDSN